MLQQNISRKLISYFFIFALAALVTGCGGGGGTDTSQGSPLNGATLSVVAKAGPIVAVRVNETATLDGSKSSTSLGASLSYNWSFSHRPDRSKATLQGATSANPSFVPDIKGVYMVQLTVSANGIESQRTVQSVVVTVSPERLTGPFNHLGLSSDCVQCHNLTLPLNARVSPAKTPNHVATSNLCQACHTPQGAAIISFTDHQEVFGNCSQCHDGVTAVGKSEFHLPTDAECDSCHTTVSFLELNPDGSYDHTNVVRACEGCHNGTVAIGKTASTTDTPPGTHPDTTSDCGYCHVTTGFLPAYPDHTDPSFADNCSSCHNNIDGIAKGEPGGHPVMNVECDSCHSIITFSMGGIYNHSLLDPTVQRCDTCHNDNTNNSINALGKGAAVPTHISTSSDCGACHGTDYFNPAFNVDHTDPAVLAVSCDSCHGAFDNTGALIATGKPATTHMPTTDDCSACHSPGTFSTGTYDHAGVVSGCNSCHNNIISAGKLPNHLPTNPDTQDCADCHVTTGFIPATFDHNGIVNNCVSCHDGNITTGKNKNHLPTAQDCSVCHTTTTIGISTVPFKDTTVTHTGINGNCESCHSGKSSYVAVGAIGKATVHIPALSACFTCHKDTATGGFATAAAFKPAVHDGFTQGCEGCHTSKFLPTANSIQNIIKASTHLPTNQDCYLCHRIDTFNPSIFAHTNITGNCSSCHDGSSNNVTAGALGKAQAPTPHPTTTSDCGSCHAIGNLFKDGTFDHAGIVSNCSSCHGDTPTSTPVGPMKNNGHLPTTQDCSVCHVPGTFKNARFDHTGIVNNCASCHNGTDATGLSVGHVDTLGKDCSACHNPTAFAGAKYDHTGISSGCVTCHNGTTAPGKTPPPNHVPTNGDCSNCHQTTGFNPGTFDHTGIVNNCSSCHDAGYATAKPSTHIATIKDCSLCHNTRTFTGAVFDHTGITSGCNACHDGTTAKGKNNAHLATSLDCFNCHTTSTFKGGTWVHDSTTAGQCDTCHNGTTAKGKNNGHLSTTSQCDICHTTNRWAPASFSHDPNGGYPGDHKRDPGCNGCHGGTISSNLPYPHPQYAPPTRTTVYCAACHANKFKSEGKHIGGKSGTVEQNKDCGGSGCHKVNKGGF